MSKVFSALCTILLFIAFTASKTHADPIVVTSGSLTVTGLDGGPQYTLFGDNFAAGGRGERGNVGLQNRVNFSSGSVVNVFATFSASALGENHGGEFN